MILMIRRRRSIWSLIWGVGSREGKWEIGRRKSEIGNQKGGNGNSEIYPEGETTGGSVVLQGWLTGPLTFQLLSLRTFQPLNLRTFQRLAWKIGKATGESYCD